METALSVSELWKKRPEVIRQFVEKRPSCEKLAEEVAYVLDKAVRRKGIEFASITYRAKTLDSFCEKIVRKKYEDPLAQVTDLVGVRIVYLYSSDKAKIEKLIQKEFVVVERIDRIDKTNADKFGYGALHFLVKLGKKTSGARYDDLKNMLCEIQVRTILQDAWSIVGHHLSYKRESDVPVELRRKLNALAGLFETADDQFNRLNADRKAYAQSLRLEISQSPADFATDLNLDSLVEYLKVKYADREGNTKDDVADLLNGLKIEGFTTLSDLDEAMIKTEKAFSAYERKYPPEPGPDEDPTESRSNKFAAVGVVRISMELLSEKYMQAEFVRDQVKPSEETLARMNEFRHLVKSPAKQ